MTEQEIQLGQVMPEVTLEHPQSDWEEIMLEGEKFKVQRDRFWPVIHKDPVTGEDKEIVFKVDIWEHPETNMKIEVHKLGLNRPLSDPVPIRADYECPCMKQKSGSIRNHDCAHQRQMMQDTIAELGIGVIAYIDEQTAGNGHGPSVVYKEADAQYKARLNGETLSMQKFYENEGYFPFDNRRHDLVALALHDSVGSDRLFIPAMQSPQKIEPLQKVGMNMLDMRIDFLTAPAASDLNMRRDGYPNNPKVEKTGAYLVYNNTEGKDTHGLLTREVYDIMIRPLGLPKPAPTLVRGPS